MLASFATGNAFAGGGALGVSNPLRSIFAVDSVGVLVGLVGLVGLARLAGLLGLLPPSAMATPIAAIPSTTGTMTKAGRTLLGAAGPGAWRPGGGDGGGGGGGAGLFSVLQK
jgi:hypothetical protein